MDEKIYDYQNEQIRKKPSFIETIEDPTDEQLKLAIECGYSFPHMFGERLTQEMVNLAFSAGSPVLSALEEEFCEKVPEDCLLKSLDNPRDIYYVLEIVKKCTITRNVARKLCKSFPVCYLDKKVSDVMTREDVSELIYAVIKIENKGPLKVPSNLPFEEEHWQYCIDNGLISRDLLRVAAEVPQNIRNIYISKEASNITDLDEITADDLICWGDAFGADEENLHWIRFLELSKEDWVKVLEKHGSLIRNISRPTAKQCEAAVKQNPANIQYIKNPSDKIAILALSLDRSVKKYIQNKSDKVCDYLGIAKKDKYPNPYYLIKMCCDVADEGYLHALRIVAGKDVEKYLKQRVTPYFGNLEGSEIYIEDIARVIAISEEEKKMLERLGLDDLESGSFISDDGDNI